jgi:superfamily II DNA or RNA helicase
MYDLSKLKFNGKFRDYQQRILDNANKYVQDRKLNIVAAPGSGKTVLGLELIRRINKPTLILSPTTAIRQQWGQRFCDMFLDDKKEFNNIFSYDLHNVKTLNSITYQALYSAISKTAVDDDDEIDLSDVDIFNTLKEFNLKVICLDEAHHLKNEWHKSLEKFIGMLEKDVIVISLTATPPYDSENSEWNKYLNLCGEIDEEIFVPELVKQKTLCPHQDYIYFNYPTSEEAAVFESYKENAFNAINELKDLKILTVLSDRINNKYSDEMLFSHTKEHIALLILFRYYRFPINFDTVKKLTTKNYLPKFSFSYAETAISYMLECEALSEEAKDAIKKVLKKHSVYNKNKVSLSLNDSLKRTLISSVGKLESIKAITESEYASLNKALRMLILTDYIKKESVDKIGVDYKFNSVNIVSIFETVRRIKDDINIGVLSGTLIILPTDIEISEEIKHKKEEIPNTRYSIYTFSGSNHNAVSYVSRLFEDGKLQILIGTKSLLGEGWDSPCINSLILASFVGSFVQSNQMRGRAIRINKNDPEKVSNIWHLVTIEPEYLFENNKASKIIKLINNNQSQLTSYDYEILKRRFDSFMGPHYETNEIENGIDRLSIIKPPYNESAIQKINIRMLELSKARDDVREKWQSETVNKKFKVTCQSEIPREKRVPVFKFINILPFILIAVLQSFIINAIISNVPIIASFSGFIIFILEALILLGFYLVLKKLILHFDPVNSFKSLGKALLKAMKECDMIAVDSTLSCKYNKKNFCVQMYLNNASMHDQNIFNTAIYELLSPIENPRYIMIKKNIFGSYDYTMSFACPTVLGKNKESAEVLKKYLKGNTANFELVYTHNPEGRKFLLKCRKNSYITQNDKQINKKNKVTTWE